MSIASLFNVPNTPEQLAQWAFDHMSHHRDVVAYLSKRYNITIPLFALDPIPIDPNDVQVWATQHAALHNTQDTLLGVPGFDLTEVDFTNKDVLQGWIWLNATLHSQEEDASDIAE